MKIEIRSFADAGNHQKERVVMRAQSDVDIGVYALFLSDISGDRTATAGLQTAFWFPDGPVKSGDLVVLYTKPGASSKKELNEGRTVHFYYWGLKEAVWGAGDKTAAVLRIAEWTQREP
jgi:hypothetical protein